MWGAFVRAGVGAVCAYGIALVVERFLGELLGLMANAPNAQSSMVYGPVQTAHENFFLLALVGVGVTLLARAYVESRIGGA